MTKLQAARLIDISAVRTHSSYEDIVVAVNLAKKYKFINVHSLPCWTKQLSQMLADVEDVCDRVCILYRGKLEVEGTVDSLLEVKDVFRIEGRNVPVELQEKMIAMLREAGVSDIHPGVQRSRLEDLFKRLVLEKRSAERAAGGAK